MLHGLAGLALLLGGCAREDAAPRRTVTVFAAASLTDALGAVADSFETAQPAYRVVLNVAATSLLARQIEQGAPADVFFSANPAWMRRVEAAGRVAPPVLEPLANRLVVAAPAGAPPLDGLAALAQQERIALADPDHVPAGLYAREGLVCAELWEAVRPRIVPTLDVRAALLAVRSGAAGLAVVYASDVAADPSVQVVLRWPEACHPEIRYAVARLRDAPAPEGASAFVAFATDPARAALWSRYGFAWIGPGAAPSAE
ncbi:MAG: molybdate ABC transporter substrate-binding protein [Rhodothermales bacterium]|nr:molybdate ABC transporter substrate-binding protein [Rhodothermales bacterium]